MITIFAFLMMSHLLALDIEYKIGSNTYINLYFFSLFTKHSDLEPKKCRKMILIKFLGRKMNQRLVLQQFHGIRKRKKMTNMLLCKFDEKISARAIFSNVKLLYVYDFFSPSKRFFLLFGKNSDYIFCHFYVGNRMIIIAREF